MTTSTVVPSAMASEWTFEDSHLTLKQKNDFWTFKISANFNNQHYEGTTLELSHSPELAKEIHQQYKLFCKNQLELKLHQAGRFSNNVEEGTKVNDSVASKNVSTSDTSITSTTAEAEKNASDTSQAQPTQKDPTRIFCVCHAFLEDTDDYFCQECTAFFTLAAKTCEYKRIMQPKPSPVPTTVNLGTPSPKKNANLSVKPAALTNSEVEPSYRLAQPSKKVPSTANTGNVTPSPGENTNSAFPKPQSNRTASHQIIHPTFSGNSTTTAKPAGSPADVPLSMPAEFSIATPSPERGVSRRLVNAQGMLSEATKAPLLAQSFTPSVAAKPTPSPTQALLHTPTSVTAMKPSSNRTTTPAQSEKNATVRLNYVPSEISLLTPPPSSSPTIELATPQKNVIDLTSIDHTPIPTNHSWSPALSLTNQDAKSEKKGRQRYPRAHCLKCEREFAINLNKNDGVSCTQCIRKAERKKELEVKPVSAVESLPASLQPAAPVAVMSPTTESGAGRKRKATSEGAVEDEIASSSNKRMRMGTPVRTMGVLDDGDDVVAMETANMTPEEKLYYGLTGFGY